jgi:hypothetical protein
MSKRHLALVKRFPITVDRPARNVASPKTPSARGSVRHLLIAQVAAASGRAHSPAKFARVRSATVARLGGRHETGVKGT